MLAVAGVQLVATPTEAAGAAFYVDRTVSSCSDTGTGSSTTPYCTVARAVAALQPGDTVYIGNGTYAETVRPALSGTSSAPVTVTAWPGRAPRVGVGVANGVNLSARSYVTISGLTIADTTGDGIFVSGSNHVTLSGNTVTGAGSPAQGATANGISIRSTSTSTVSGNTTDRNSGHGILLTSGSTGITVSHNEASLNAEGWRRNANGINVISAGNTLIGNITHDNEDTGINLYPGGDNNLAALNVTYDNGDHGIDNLNVTGGRLIGNTVYRNCTSGINVEGTSGNYTVVNNVAVDNAVYPAYNGISCNRRKGNIGIFDSAPSSTTVDHNLVFLTRAGTMYTFGSGYSSLAAMQAATGQEDHGVQADPRFASASGGDLRLTAGSPAIDRADSGVSGEQSVDLLGNPRVDDPSMPNSGAEGPRLYDDLGAYEFQPSGAPPPGNQAPTARLTLSPTSGTAPLQVSADASTSTDPEAQTLRYSFTFGDGTTVGPQPGATASHTFAAAGTYQVAVTVTDTGGLSGTATGTVTVSAVGGGGGGTGTTVERRVASGADDVEQAVSGAMFLTSSDIELTTDGSLAQIVGTRFTGLQIPRGATITNAYVQFQVDEATTGATALTIKAESSDNAAAYTSASGSVAARATTGSVAWNPPAWSTVGAAGADQRTPNIAGLVQAVVGRAGWTAGNALALQFSGTGRRTAVAFEGSSTGAALLHIEYTVA